jgi:hypothetical protein
VREFLRFAPHEIHGIIEKEACWLGKTSIQARELSQAIAHRAYWNSSYLAETYEDLKKAGLW